MKRNRIRYVVVGFVFLLVLSPVISSIFNFGNIMQIDENRNRKTFPSQFSLMEADSWYNKLSAWFDDNFGLRDILIRTQHQFDYSLFHLSKELWIDDDSYLYYKTTCMNMVKIEELDDSPDDTKFQDIISKYEKIKAFLEDKNVMFKFIIPPQKIEVLPNAKSAIPLSRPDPDGYRRLETKIQASPLADNYVPVLDLLLAGNRNNPVFYRCDFHWNDYGAALGFGAVINSISNDLGMGDVYDPSRLQITSVQEPNGVQQLSNLSVLYYSPPKSVTANYPETANYQKDENYHNYKLHGMGRWINRGEAVFDGPVLFIGDSYSFPVTEDYHNTSIGILGYFPEAYFCHWDNCDAVLNYLPKNVKYVVMERIESAILTMDEYLGRVIDENAPAVETSDSYRTFFANDFYLNSNVTKQDNKYMIANGGIVFGPYVPCSEGKYTVSIYGEHLNKLNYDVCSSNLDTYYSIRYLVNTQDMVEYVIELPEDVPDIQFRLYNYSDEISVLDRVVVEKQAGNGVDSFPPNEERLFYPTDMNRYGEVDSLDPDCFIIHPGGVVFGPYLAIPEGQYTVSVFGDGMDNLSVDVYSGENKRYFPVEILYYGSDCIVFETKIDSKINDIEFRLFNNSLKDVLYYHTSVVRK